ncbi:hypothetical protein [Blackfly microvirus SF02]|uniref:Uncharacterized protein n=1 Tax=Blackfly microvirus SF02 TaxID=2576452 RepID=A0A4P8PSZ4_9VIRU|nr:hypothetical protein [Blackfly microvirus SF02]
MRSKKTQLKHLWNKSLSMNQHLNKYPEKPAPLCAVKYPAEQLFSLLKAKTKTAVERAHRAHSSRLKCINTLDILMLIDTKGLKCD